MKLKLLRSAINADNGRVHDVPAATHDEQPATFVVKSASGRAVPVSAPLSKKQLHDLTSGDIVEQVNHAREDAGVA